MAENSRRIRSYVIRAARMSDAQKSAYERLSPSLVIPYSKNKVIWDELFPERGRRIVEVGFGMGDATRRMAADHPEWGILGVEVHRPGVGKLLWWMEKESLTNIRIVEHDAVEVMESMIPRGSVDGFHIWFPDPWPKKRHHKRRLIQPEFTASAVRCLKEGGYFHAATDWEPYAEHIRHVLDATPALVNTADSWAAKPDYRPATKFENRGIAAERKIRDLIYRKESK